PSGRLRPTADAFSAPGRLAPRRDVSLPLPSGRARLRRAALRGPRTTLAECVPSMSMQSSRPLALLGRCLGAVIALLIVAAASRASEADLAIPNLHAGRFDTLGGISAWSLLFWGAWVICGTLGISLYLRTQIHRLPAHKSMLAVADTIYTTCKT